MLKENNCHTLDEIKYKMDDWLLSWNETKVKDVIKKY